ncbi:MAG: hypothetical protein Ct9H300mP25_09420 [Acidobacteriota bacterium]|nr:MAG: hypothetical protein Ct9H300mP25_09420 [Acidobacteriota bacterium]
MSLARAGRGILFIEAMPQALFWCQSVISYYNYGFCEESPIGPAPVCPPVLQEHDCALRAQSWMVLGGFNDSSIGEVIDGVEPVRTVPAAITARRLTTALRTIRYCRRQEHRLR